MSDTSASRLADLIGRDILEGRIAPGTRLDEKSLADAHATSRTPVREALTELCGRGLAVRRPYRGVEVIAPDPVFLAESFEAMSEVEAICAGLAAGRISLTEAVALEDVLARMEVARAAGDPDAYRALNAELHEAIFAASGNSQLAKIASDLRQRFELLRRAQLGQPERMESSHTEHQALVRAICDRDAPEASRIMRRHLRSAMAATLRILEN